MNTGSGVPSVEVELADLRLEIERLRGLVVYINTFSAEGGQPSFQQGGQPHELMEVVTSEDCALWVRLLADRKEAP